MIENIENPYVFNSYFFANSPNSFVYGGTPFAFVHKTLHLFAFFGGLLTCSMSIYLIVCKTPEYIRQFSRVLLLCAYLDMVYLLLVFGRQPVGQEFEILIDFRLAQQNSEWNDVGVNKRTF
jgi:hypothetical protein